VTSILPDHDSGLRAEAVPIDDHPSTRAGLTAVPDARIDARIDPRADARTHNGAGDGSGDGSGDGGELGLEQLYDEHYVRLVRLGVLLLGDAGRAEEVVQDSFVAVVQRWDRLEGANLPAYLRQTVVNRSRSVLRHRKVVAAHPSEVPAHGPAADHELLRGVRRRAVIDALAGLPRRQREVLALRHYLDLSEREIAETLRISPGAVKSHASRGSAALRRALSALLEETS
jgi:RNA polymerase sigma-70 factor (sigma-E family)